MPKRDLLGQRFGKLTVVGENPVRKNSQIQWDCVCDCGGTKTTVSSCLTGGHTNSCGCKLQEVISKKDLLGQKFGRLTVTGENPERDNFRQVMWDCVCDCGNKTTVRGSNLRKGQTTSCGCYNLERVIETKTKHGHSPKIGESPTYIKWRSMKARCTNSNQDPNRGYVKRGIKVCDRWLNSFENFLEDMGECPEGYSIERIDVNGDYCPENCKWIPLEEQAANKRNNRLLTFRGETLPLRHWAERMGLDEGCVRSRIIDLGWSVDKALTTPSGDYVPQIEYQGRSQSLGEWAKELGLQSSTLSVRLNKYGWSVEKAFETPVNDHLNMVEFNGKIQTVSCWARELGMKPHTLRHRLKKGWSVEDALTIPVGEQPKQKPPAEQGVQWLQLALSG